MKTISSWLKATSVGYSVVKIKFSIVVYESSLSTIVSCHPESVLQSQQMYKTSNNTRLYFVSLQIYGPHKWIKSPVDILKTKTATNNKKMRIFLFENMFLLLNDFYV